MMRYLVLRSMETLGRVVYEVKGFDRVTDAKRYVESRGGVLIPASDVGEVCKKLKGVRA